MELHTQLIEQDNRLILKAYKELNIFNARKFEEEMLKAIQEQDKSLTLDFTELEYISSAAIRVIIMCAKKLFIDNKKIKCLLRRNSKAQNIFSIAGLYSVLDTQEV